MAWQPRPSAGRRLILDGSRPSKDSDDPLEPQTHWDTDGVDCRSLASAHGCLTNPPTAMATPPSPAELAPHLFALMDASHQAFALYDRQDRLLYANARFRTLMALAPDAFPTWVELIRGAYARSSGTRIQARNFETWLASARSRRGKLPFRLFETDYHGGRWFQVAETTLPSGGMLCVLTDVSALGAEGRETRLQRDQARKAALTDELTGLSNRRHLLERLHHLLGEEPGMAVAMLDLDHFAEVNATFGHEVGDGVLRHAARLLQQHTGLDDLCGRIGSDQFLLVMRHTERAAAAQRMDDLLQDVRARQPVPGLPQLRITASAGLVFAEPGDSITGLLTRADRLRHASKTAGRQRCLVDLGAGEWGPASAFRQETSTDARRDLKDGADDAPDHLSA